MSDSITVGNASPQLEIKGFELCESLGDGSMGAVYRAIEQATNRVVALKVLYPVLAGNPTYLERFVREAQSASRLSHPNLVSVYGAGRCGQMHYMYMEYVDGTNLREVMHQEKSLSEGATAAIGLCVSSALHYAWQTEQLIHRDVKPENLLVGHDGRVLVCDLGIAKRVNSGSDVVALTRTGLCMGTPHYIAPEQARGEKHLDCRVDIYSLGATLYHCITGHTIHHADSEFSLMMKHVTEPVQDPRMVNPDISEPMALMLLGMLEVDREKRVNDWCHVYDTLFSVYETAVANGSDAQIPLVNRKNNGTSPQAPTTPA